MAQTSYVEMREGEEWQDVARAFLMWCTHHKRVVNAGCHEGDSGGPSDGRRYAAISIPDHSPALLNYLREWATSDGRSLGS
jgi:hypothetical protein